MATVADRVKETTTTAGTGAVSLGGAVTGFQAFSDAFASGTVVYYCITDGTNWEVGYGAVTAGTPWTLARTTVLDSSNAGALVNWAAGSKDVFCTSPAILSQETISTKLPSIDCTQSGGALTFSMVAQYLDFRNVSLTSGTPATINCAPANLVLASGGTLGAVTTVSARIVLAVMNNAGTAELAVANIAGGLDMSETGLISTTAIGAGSTANNVWYSTSARTNLAYRIIGAFDVVNTAGAWGSPTSKINAGGNALTSMSSLGYGQNYQNVSASRAIGTTYYNISDRPKFVLFGGTGSAGGAWAQPNINGSAYGGGSQAYGIGGEVTLSFIVPPHQSYSITNGFLTITITNWAELG